MIQKGYILGKSVHESFEDQVESTPDAIALVFEAEQLTYRELNTRANQLAHYLRSLGVGPEMPVAIGMERSLEMVVGILGILKAGGAYVPLDPKYPKERLDFMVKDSNSPVLVTKRRMIKELSMHRFQAVLLDEDWEKIAQQSSENPPVMST
jgi:non-ribosomal peptide synthetase component F